MGMEHWWTDTNRGKTEVFGENAASLSLCHHKSHMDCHGNEPRDSW